MRFLLSGSLALDQPMRAAHPQIPPQNRQRTGSNPLPTSDRARKIREIQRTQRPVSSGGERENVIAQAREGWVVFARARTHGRDAKTQSSSVDVQC
eukprot:206030-Rhodomonas_salina.2